MTDTDLIERLEKATEGSRGLSDDCLIATGWTFKQYEARRHKVPYDWVTPDGKGIVEYGKQPDPTRDAMDAVKWLVPPDCGWDIGLIEPGDGYQAHVMTPHHWMWSATKRPTPGLAMSLAALRARQSETPDLQESE